MIHGITITNIKINAILMLFVLDKHKYILIMDSWVTQTPISTKTLKTTNWRNIMSNYEQQILTTSQFYDTEMKVAELENIEILHSVVPGSRLHEVIHNPVDSGIDEG